MRYLELILEQDTRGTGGKLDPNWKSYDISKVSKQYLLDRTINNVFVERPSEYDGINHVLDNELRSNEEFMFLLKCKIEKYLHSSNYKFAYTSLDVFEYCKDHSISRIDM